jgi:translocation and assembly module TamB
LSAAARFDFGALGRAEAQVELAGWRPGADMSAQSLGGRVQAEVNDLGLVSRLSPALDDARGTLRADVALGGTLSNPALSGTAKLVDGAVAVPQIGITLSGITMEASNTPENVIKFVARGKSGPGFVELRGEFVPDKERGWPVLVEITGRDFEAVNLPEARVLASPDLQLLIVRNRIDLNGVLAIPEARYAARDTSEAITPSSDVVVLGKDKQPEREEKWQIYSAVRFVFGDKVTFNGFGLKGKVRGEVVALEEPKKLTTGYGELQIVDATFNAYKIDLKVTRGRLTFAGGPINNPGIDARAVREAGTIREAAAKDEKQELREPGGIVVGALVRGTLRKLELTLFSDPPRDQADVLALLLFGVPLGEATTEEGKALFLAASTLRLSGRDDTVRKIGRRFGIEEIRLETGATPDQAALVLGRYLGPRLYVNYSVGLLSTTANVLRVRYRISDKWTLQSEQSDVESAADLLYTFEH